MLQIGINPTEVRTATEGPAYRVGTRGSYSDPVLGYQEFIYGKAPGGISANAHCCVERTGFEFLSINSTLVAAGSSGPGSRVGVSMAVIAANGFGWFQVYGKATIRVLINAAKGTRLNTTASLGILDDDGTAASGQIFGVVLGTTQGAAGTNSDAMLNYPAVGITL